MLVGQGAVTFPSNLGPEIVAVRLLPSGLPDPAFGQAGVARPAISGFSLGTTPTAVAIDSQGRTVIGGGARDSSPAMADSWWCG